MKIKVIFSIHPESSSGCNPLTKERLHSESPGKGCVGVCVCRGGGGTLSYAVMFVSDTSLPA